MDELTAFLDDSDDIWKVCGWRQVHCYNDEYNDDRSTTTYCTATVTEFVYGDECEECNESCQSEFGYDEDDYCKTQGSGDVWLGCGIIGILLLFVAIMMIAIKIWKDTTTQCNGHYNVIPAIVCVFAGLFFIISIAVWIVDNPVCWDSDLLDDKEIDLGASPYWMMAAVVMSMAACPLSVA